MYVGLSVAARNAALDVILGLLNAGPAAGTLEIRTGAAPAAVEDAATGTLLVTFTLADPAFNAAASGAAEIDAAPVLSAVAAASGTAGWARLKDSTGIAVADLDVDTATAALNLSTTVITSGETITIGPGSVAF